MKRHLLIILVVFTKFLFATNATSVVVLDFFEFEDQEKRRYASMSNIFEVELKAKNTYSIIERSSLNAFLKLEENRSLRGCDSITCQIEIGRLLGVDKIITGTLLRFEDFSSFNFKLIEVETGFTEKSFGIEINRSESSDVLIGCKRGAALLNQYAVTSVPLNAKSSVLLPTNLINRQPESDFHLNRPKTKDIKVQVGLFTLSAISLGVGYYFDTKVSQAYSTYGDYTHDKSQVLLDSEWENVQNNELKRNVFYGIAFAVLMGGISYTVFF